MDRLVISARSLARGIVAAAPSQARAARAGAGLLVAAIVAVLATLWLYAQSAGPALYERVATGPAEGQPVIAAAVAIAPLLVVAAACALVWAGAVARLADAGAAGRGERLGSALWASVRAVPRAAAAIVAWVLGVVAVIAITPALVIGGIAGLAVVAVVAVVAVGPRKLPQWLPPIRTLVILAIPLGAAAVVATRSALALAFVWADRLSVRSAFAASWRATAHRVGRVAGALLGAALAVVAATEATVWVAGQVWGGPSAGALARLAVQVAAGSLPVIVMTLLRRPGSLLRGGPATSGRPLVTARRARVAAVLVASFVVQAALAAGPVARASADPLAASAVTVTTAPGSGIVAGNEFAVKVSVAPAAPAGGDPVPTGAVTATLDGAPVAGSFPLDVDTGEASIPFPAGLTAGSYHAVVTYPGDATYAGGVGEITFAVSGGLAVSLGFDDASLAFGDTLVASAQVTGLASPTGGTVAFVAFPATGPTVDLGTAPLDASGLATLSTTALPPGDYELVATYQGDVGGAPTSAPAVDVTVAALFTQTEITLSPTSTPSMPTPPGETVTAHVTVTAIGSALVPGGVIELYPQGGGDLLGSGSLVGGEVEIDVVLPPGSPVVRAVYGGGTGFGASESSAQQYVAAWPSTLTLAAPASSAVGDVVRLEATVVSSAVPTGNVAFIATPTVGAPIPLGTAPLDGAGVAALDVASLAAGAYTLTATYAGDGTAGPSSSAGRTLTVTAAAAVVTVDVANATPYFATGVLATVTLSAVAGGGTPTGTVDLRRDGVLLQAGVALSAGVAHVSYDSGDAGEHTLTAEYSGDSTFAAATGGASITSQRRATTVTVEGAAHRSAIYGSDDTYQGAVIATGGAHIPTGTVQLWADGYLMGSTTVDGSGNWEITTDRIPALEAPATRVMMARYLGSTNFAPADSDGAVTTEMVRADGTPALTIGPGTPGFGGTYTLTATIADVGDGPTGTVTFQTTTGDVIGTAPVVNGVAETPITIAAIDTFLTATYVGDANFAPGTSAVLHVEADRAATTVELLTSPSGPGTFAYGSTLDLVARVTIAGGGDTDGLVTFRFASGGGIAANVPTVYFPSLGYGIARVTVCSGDTAGCPVGMPTLGVFDQQIVADYPDSSVSVAASSLPIAYEPTGAPTSTTLVATPTTVLAGSAIILTATVTNLVGGLAPEGTVSFYATDPSAPGYAEYYLGYADVAGGIASLTPAVGAGGYDVRWPADAVVARFFDVSGTFASSNDSEAITVVRAATTVTATHGAAAHGASGTISVTLDHAPGVSGPYQGRVRVYVDGASDPVCNAAAAPTVSCTVTWSGVGDHEIVATYSGDVIYAPSTSAPHQVEVVKGQASYAPMFSGSPVAQQPSTVSWAPGALTGTMTVWADGTEWCVVDVTAGECAGSFTNASATGAPVEVRARYSGDGAYEPTEKTVSVVVRGCYPVDVYSGSPSTGTVTVDTPSSCGTNGYPEGSSVTASAHPVAPYAFDAWYAFTAHSAGMVRGPVTPTLTFTVTREGWTWAHRAVFELPCFAITPAMTGHGAVLANPAPSCTTASGAAGYPLGTTVTLTPYGTRDPATGAVDDFYEFGTLPPGVTTSLDRAGHPRVTVTATKDFVIPMIFGPHCVTVSGSTLPAADGDAFRVVTEPTCFSPQGDGYRPFTTVEVSVAIADESRVVTDWQASGAEVTSSGASATATVALGMTDAALTANVVSCYAVTVVLDGASWRSEPVGTVSLDRPPNCPDGGPRYLAGTVVSATPSIERAGTIFRGWDGDTTAGNGGVETGPLPSATKAFTVTEPVTLTASFYLADACSRLSVFDRQGLVKWGTTGCGEGFYSDEQKQWAGFFQVPQSDPSVASYRSTLTVTKDPDQVLDVYASVRGDATQCFGTDASAAGSTGWRSLGALRGGRQDCLVGGDMQFRFEACQTLDPEVAITRKGDATGAVFDKGALPPVLYVRTEAGNFAPMDTRTFKWVTTLPVEEADDAFGVASLSEGACKDSGHAFQPGLTVMLGADAPTTGFAFRGWTSDASTELLTANPVLMETDDSRAVMPVSAAYEIACYHVTFGEGITIMGDTPRCPGYTDDENMFIGGAAILVKADQHVGSRIFGAWQSGVVTATSVEDPVTGERTAFAYVSGDMKVAAKYPTEGERWEAGFATVGKVLLGVTAVIAPIALGVACPPCGVALAAVTLVTTVTSMIPGGGKVTAFLDMINPTKLLECTTNWGFSNGKDAHTESSSTSVLTVGLKEKKIISYLKPPPTAAQAAASAAKTLTKSSATGAKVAVLKLAAKDSLQLAGFVYSLYDAGLFETDLGYKDDTQIRDTAGFKTCLDDAYRFAK